MVKNQLQELIINQMKIISTVALPKNTGGNILALSKKK